MHKKSKHMVGICLSMGLRLLFLPNILGATFIPEATFIPDSRVDMIFLRFIRPVKFLLWTSVTQVLEFNSKNVSLYIDFLKNWLM